MLYNSFSNSLTSLNGILLSPFKDHKENKLFQCNDLKANLIETGVICCVLQSYISLDTIELSRNLIDSNCLILISKTLSHLTNIHKIVLNYNPLTTSLKTNDIDENNNNKQDKNGSKNSGTIDSTVLDLRGINEFMNMLRINQWVVDVELYGCKVPPKIQENIERSLMVNRSIGGMLRGNLFALYLSKQFHDRDNSKPKSASNLWKPSLTLDPYFLMSKQSPVSEINAIVEGDRIILPKGIGGLKKGDRKINS